MVFELKFEPQLLVTVNVNVAVPTNATGGFQVAFRSVADGEKIPPIPPSVHKTVLAPEPIDAPNGAEVPIIQMAGIAEPMFIGTSSTEATVMVYFAVAGGHGLFETVNVKVTIPATASAATAV